ncbi:MAG: 3-keto-disaccharide hydrolase, partial [Planctomycetota bacterium]
MILKTWKIVTFISFLIIPLSLCAGSPSSDAVLEAKKVMESADLFMGDWEGEWELDSGADYGSLVAQVIAGGKGQYRTVLSYEFDTRREPIAVLDGKRDGESVKFAGKTFLSDMGLELEIRAEIKEGKFEGSFKGDESGTFEMSKVIRLSPALGAKPPEGAIILFDGKDFKKWKHARKKQGEDDKVKWELVDGAMRVKPGTGSIITRQEFKDVKLHIEFRSPFMPDKRGQARGNSGVYLQGRYEVQILDSYALEGRDNECGGIYKVGPPLVNMCAPPTQWQTYDITFHAPRFDADGKIISYPTLTVLHNGINVHDKTEA